MNSPLESRRWQNLMLFLIRCQDKEFLAILAQLGWNDVFVESGRAWGFSAGNVMPTAVPYETVEEAKVKLCPSRYESWQWKKFSFKEKIGLKLERLRHNLLTRSSIDVAGIKLPEPDEGIVVVGRHLLSGRDRSGRLHTYDIVRRLLGQYLYQGLKVECCNAPTASLPELPLDAPLVLGIDDFVSFRAKEEALNLVLRGHCDGLHSVVGLPSINPRSHETKQLLSSMKTWIITACDESTALECARYFGREFDPARFYALPANAFWMFSCVGGQWHSIFGELRG